MVSRDVSWLPRQLALIVTLLFAIISLSAQNSFGSELQSVSLQLQWKHQFEFAGFYAAKEMGFYKQAGLEVEIREYQAGDDVIADVLSGEVNYGTYYPSVIAERLSGKPLVLLANIFKHSPLVLVTKPKIKEPADLKDKRIMMTREPSMDLRLLAMFKQAGISDDDYTHIKLNYQNKVGKSGSVDDFVADKIDAFSALLTDQIYELEQRGIAYNVIDPAEYIGDLSDVYLFASQQELNENPHRSQRFIAASIKGWQYAIKHPDEIIELILDKYSTLKSREQLRFEARETIALIKPETFPVGSLQREQIARTANIMVQLGLIKPGYDLAGAIFNRNTKLLQLTDEEQKWLDIHPILRVSSEKDWPPFDFQKNAVPVGYDIDYLKIIARRLGIKFEYVIGKTWQQLLEMGKNKQLDIIHPIVQTEARNEFFNFTKDFLKLSVAMVVQKHKPWISSLEGIIGKRLVVVKGYASKELLKNRYPPAEIIEVISPLEALEAVASNNADVFVSSLGVVNYLMGEHFLTNLEVLVVPGLDKKQFFQLRLGVRKDWPILRDILQKAMDSISEKELIATKKL